MQEKILETIKKYETIIVHRHVRPDPDAYGSQCGLVEMLRASFPEKKIYAVGREEPSLHFMQRLDTIEDAVYNGALVIVCDTANTERICDSRYTLGDMLIKIDHHPNEDPYGDLLWVDTSASSCSEMIYDFYLFGKEQGLNMNDKAARLLYGGIVGDTGRFLYPSTTEKTFSHAGELIQYNFSRTELYDKMYELDLNIIKLNGYILQNFELQEYGVASVILTKELLEEFGAKPPEASLLVSTLGDVKGITAWVFFIEEDDQIRLRLRSKGPVINGVARKFKGGGHPLAAGASIHSWDEVDLVLNELREVCKSHS
ncbi:bifunctional oligoribonuclease/PAP phosphatase NrnA [Bacillus salipaludis]|uniref:Bifunctional oligoribonuclease/PAP phosphatase NrnA n=1 Tax=Bacillus salipaludis TaxID=2547811 RepID=A0A4R5VRY1_9BACI|nr:bifunctional oligoribonuclease/PAP phosphatase NrnA [Bacillus salipaludis]MDQ6599918.1 bifunctional oligoribonuclease/PAP phosphatase NrnA [Bacillus salipaludis]TDK61476.1 bifunctional oligoribonuclease/PAP phosphatase NrnA [Bacillus salipaludis]